MYKRFVSKGFRVFALIRLGLQIFKIVLSKAFDLKSTIVCAAPCFVLLLKCLVYQPEVTDVGEPLLM